MNDLENMMITVVMRSPKEAVKVAMNKLAAGPQIDLKKLMGQAKTIQQGIATATKKNFAPEKIDILKNRLNTIMGDIDTATKGVEKDWLGNYKLTQKSVDNIKADKQYQVAPEDAGATFWEKLWGSRKVPVTKDGKTVYESRPVDSYWGKFIGRTPNADKARELTQQNWDKAMSQYEQDWGEARGFLDDYRRQNNLQRDRADMIKGSPTDFLHNLRGWDKNQSFLNNIYNIGDSVVNNPAVKTWGDRFNRANNAWMYANALTGNMPQQLLQQGMYSLIPHQQTFWESLHPGMQSMIIGGAGLGAGMAGYGLYRNLSRKKEQQPQYAPVMMMPVKQSSLKPEMQKEAGIGNPFRAAADALTSGYNKVNDFFNNPELLKWENGIGNWLDLAGNGLQFANTTLGGVDTLADIIRLRMQTPKTTTLAGLSDGAKALISAGVGGGLAYGGYKAMKELEGSKPEDTAVSALAQRRAGLW